MSKKNKTGGGYYYDLPLINKKPSVKYYVNKCPPDFISGGTYHSGGNKTPGVITKMTLNPDVRILHKGGFQGLVTLLKPLTKSKLVSLILLLFLNQYTHRKKQTGGAHLNALLMPLGKNMLLVIASILSLQYFTKNAKKIQKGGGKKSSSHFYKGIINILQTKKQTGGNLYNNITQFLAPIGNNSFVATALLVFLNDQLFKQKKRIQKGGGNELLAVLTHLLMPLGVNKFLSTLGLTFLNNYMQSGGGVIDFNTEKPITYSKDLKQFGCVIPEWGYNLKVNGCDCV